MWSVRVVVRLGEDFKGKYFMALTDELENAKRIIDSVYCQLSEIKNPPESVLSFFDEILKNLEYAILDLEDD